eukprot:m51a1_g8906 putative wd-40 repeat-containing protein (1746) ;mRNA; r:752544-760058
MSEPTETRQKRRLLMGMSRKYSGAPLEGCGCSSASEPDASPAASPLVPRASPPAHAPPPVPLPAAPPPLPPAYAPALSPDDDAQSPRVGGCKSHSFTSSAAATRPARPQHAPPLPPPGGRALSGSLPCARSPPPLATSPTGLLAEALQQSPSPAAFVPSLPPAGGGRGAQMRCASHRQLVPRSSSVDQQQQGIAIVRVEIEVEQTQHRERGAAVLTSRRVGISYMPSMTLRELRELVCCKHSLQASMYEYSAPLNALSLETTLGDIAFDSVPLRLSRSSSVQRLFRVLFEEPFGSDPLVIELNYEPTKTLGEMFALACKQGKCARKDYELRFVGRWDVPCNPETLVGDIGVNVVRACHVRIPPQTSGRRGASRRPFSERLSARIEPELSRTLVFDEVDGKKTLRAATLPSLVHYLLDTFPQDVATIEEFVLTIRYIANPNDVLRQITDAYSGACSAAARPYKCTADVVRNNVMLVLRCWLELNVEDFISDDQLCARLLDFVVASEDSLSGPITTRSAFWSLKGLLTRKMLDVHAMGAMVAGMKDERTGVQFIKQPDGKETNFFIGWQAAEWMEAHMAFNADDSAAVVDAMLAEGIARTTAPVLSYAESGQFYLPGEGSEGHRFGVLEYDPADFAKQLALCFLSHLRRVRNSELTKLAWTKEATSPELTRIRGMLRNLKAWLVMEVLSQMFSRRRLDSLRRLVALAQACYQQANFLGVQLLVDVWRHPAILRLTGIWLGVPQRERDTVTKLEALVDPCDLYKRFRAAVPTRLKSKERFIFLPILGTCPAPHALLCCLKAGLEQMRFIETLPDHEGPSGAEGGELLVNWTKMRLLAKALREIHDLQLQQRPCNYHPALQRTIAQGLRCEISDELLLMHSRAVEPSLGLETAVAPPTLAALLEHMEYVKGGYSQDAHTATILCVTMFTGRLVTGSEDCTIRFWDTETLKQTRILTGHKSAVTCLEALGDKALLSASTDGTIIVWAWNSGLKQVGCERTMMPITSLAWDATRSLLLAAGKDTIFVYSLRDYKTLVPAHKPIKHHRDFITCLAAQDGKVVSGSFDSSIVVFDPATGRRVMTIADAHKSAVSALTFDPGRETIISGSYDQRLKVWSKDGTELHELKGFMDVVGSAAFNPLTQTLWVTANASSPIVFDPVTATNVTPFIAGLVPTQNSSETRLFQRVRYLPESKEMVATTNQREVFIWRLNRRRPVTSITVPASFHRALVCSQKTGHLFSAGADGSVWSWEAASQRYDEMVYTPRHLTSHGSPVVCMAYDDSIDVLIAGCEDHSVKMWGQSALAKEGVSSAAAAAADEGEEGEGGDDEAGGEQEALSEVQGSTASSMCVVASSQQKPVRSGGFWAPVAITEHKDRVSSVTTALLGEKHYAISAGWDGAVCVWNTTTMTLSWKSDSHESRITMVSYAQELGEFATAVAGSPVAHIWGLEKRREIKQLVGHEAELNQVAWNAVLGEWVTCAQDRTLRTWGPDGAQLQVIDTDGEISAMCIDTSNGLVVGASSDHRIRLYHIENTYKPVRCSYTGTQRRGNGHEDMVNSIVHVARSRHYVSSSYDRTIRVWREISLVEEESADDPAVPGATSSATTMPPLTAKRSALSARAPSSAASPGNSGDSTSSDSEMAAHAVSSLGLASGGDVTLPPLARRAQKGACGAVGAPERLENVEMCPPQQSVRVVGASPLANALAAFDAAAMGRERPQKPGSLPLAGQPAPVVPVYTKGKTPRKPQQGLTGTQLI